MIDPENLTFGMRARGKPEMRVNNDPVTDGRTHVLPPGVLGTDRRTEVDERLAATARMLVDANDTAGHPQHLSRMVLFPWLRKPGRNSGLDLPPDAPRILIPAPSSTED